LNNVTDVWGNKKTQWAKAIVVDKYNIYSLKKGGEEWRIIRIFVKNQQKQLQEIIIKYDGVICTDNCQLLTMIMIIIIQYIVPRYIYTMFQWWWVMKWIRQNKNHQ